MPGLLYTAMLPKNLNLPCAAARQPQPVGWIQKLLRSSLAVAERGGVSTQQHG